MARYKRFTFLCNKEERWIIAALATHLQRSQSDAVRFLIKAASKELDLHSFNSEGKDQDDALCSQSTTRELPDAT